MCLNILFGAFVAVQRNSIRIFLKTSVRGKGAGKRHHKWCSGCPQEPDETSMHLRKFDMLLPIGERCKVGKFSLLFLPK